jgi:hypothetical protein
VESADGGLKALELAIPGVVTLLLAVVAAHALVAPSGRPRLLRPQETGERSDLVLYPARSLAPGEMFLVRIAPSGSVPLAVKRTVPSRITPVMDLG